MVECHLNIGSGEWPVVLSFISKVFHFVVNKPGDTIALYGKFRRQHQMMSVFTLFFTGINVLEPKMLTLGKDVFIGPNAYISGEVEIGDRVMIGPRCIFIDRDHNFGRIGEHLRYVVPEHGERKKITLQEDVWIGAGVIVLKGVTIGRGCVVGAGSVVLKDMPPYCVCAGNPCMPIKYIFTDDDLKEHLGKLGYDEKAAAETIRRRSEAKAAVSVSN